LPGHGASGGKGAKNKNSREKDVPPIEVGGKGAVEKRGMGVQTSLTCGLEREKKKKEIMQYRESKTAVEHLWPRETKLNDHPEEKDIGRQFCKTEKKVDDNCDHQKEGPERNCFVTYRVR